MESATDFDDELYYKTIAAANFSDELITRHSEIMNRYDPEKKNRTCNRRVGLLA